MDAGELSYFEKRLSREIEDIERRIKRLADEKQALQRQIAKARAERTGIQSVTRKNSLNRVLAENSIVEYLQMHPEGASTSTLYRNAQITNFDLKESTFRTYLHRMKNRELIKTAKSAGHWELNAPKHNT